ncbi:MAG: hypothetical protein Q9160_009278 [Pyrenula sp. 1 TL-2023]
MAWLKALWSRQSSTTVPAECYDECNNAALTAESTGKTPALCQAGSQFQEELEHCQQCIASKRGGDAFNSTVQPQFQQFLGYCSSLSPSESSSFESQALQQSSIAAQQSSLSAALASLNTTSGSYAPSVVSLLAEQTSASELLTSLDAQLFPLTQNHTVTGNLLLSSLTVTQFATATPATTPATAVSQVSHSSVEVIAPAVIAPIVGLSAIGAAIIYVLRRGRRRQHKKTHLSNTITSSEYVKPELHADDIRPELDRSIVVERHQEVQRSLSMPPRPVELPAAEPAGREMG